MSAKASVAFLATLSNDPRFRDVDGRPCARFRVDGGDEVIGFETEIIECARTLCAGSRIYVEGRPQRYQFPDPTTGRPRWGSRLIATSLRACT